MPDNLFERIDGPGAVEAAVDLFYRKVLMDDEISNFFDTTDMDGQRAKQKAFLTMAFGGPNEYTGADLRVAHEKLVADGLNDSHFDKVAGHLRATLEELAPRAPARAGPRRSPSPTTPPWRNGGSTCAATRPWSRQQGNWPFSPAPPCTTSWRTPSSFGICARSPGTEVGVFQV